MKNFIVAVAMIFSFLVGSESGLLVMRWFLRPTEGTTHKALSIDTSGTLISPILPDPVQCSAMREISKGQQEIQRSLRASALMNSPSGRASVAEAGAAAECARLGVDAYCEGKDVPPCP